MSRSETAPDESAPKYLHLAEQLATRLRAGEWGLGKVPTVRDIAGTYDVSSFTASRALQVLRERGLVVTRDRSGSYVAGDQTDDAPLPPLSSSRWVVVTRVSPGPGRSASESVVNVGFERLAREGSFTVWPLDLPVGSGRADAERAVKSVASGGVKGVFFLPSRVSGELCRQDEWFLAGCRAIGLPIVLIDRNLRGADRPLEYDLVASDHFDGGLRCTEHLLALGRKRVACVIASPTSTHTDRLAGYLSAIQKTGHCQPLAVRVPEHLDTREAYPWIADELVRLGVDGAICYQDYVAVGVILELFRRGLNVPRDVAVVGCDDLPIGQSFALGVSSYTYPSEALSRIALRVMTNRIAHPDDPLVKVVLAGRLVVRDSTVVS